MTTADDVKSWIDQTNSLVIAQAASLAAAEQQVVDQAKQIADLKVQLDSYTKPTMLVGLAMQTSGTPIPDDMPADVHRTYWTLPKDEDKAIAMAKADVEAGRVPILSFKVGNWKTALGNSEISMSVSRVGQALRALNARILCAVHSEPENDGVVSDWVAIQDLFGPLLDFPNAQVEYGIIVTGYSQLPKVASNWHLSEIWPKVAKPRFVLFDIYQGYGTVKKGVKNTDWKDIAGIYAKQLAPIVKSYGAYWGLAETGVTDAAYDDNKDPKTNYWDVLLSLGRDWECRIVSYFNSDLNSIGTWPIGSGQKYTDYVNFAVAARGIRV